QAPVESEDDAALSAVAAGAAAKAPGTKPAGSPSVRGNRTTTILTAAAVSFAVVAIASLVVILLLNSRGNRVRQPGDRTVTSKEMRANSDLLTLKSEAEALAIEGKLAE